MKSLRRLQSDDDVVNVYLDLIRDEIHVMDDSKQGKTLSTWELFCSIQLRKQLIIGIAVQLMMQFSGIDAVFYYLTTIFYEAEVNDPELATTLLGIINVLVTIVAVKVSVTLLSGIIRYLLQIIAFNHLIWIF